MSISLNPKHGDYCEDPECVTALLLALFTFDSLVDTLVQTLCRLTNNRKPASLVGRSLQQIFNDIFRKQVFEHNLSLWANFLYSLEDDVDWYGRMECALYKM